MTALRTRRGDTSLIIVDVQDRLSRVMPQPTFDDVARNVVRLIACAEKLALPVCVSEQNPDGLGRTVPVLKEAVARVNPPAVYFDKMAFSLADEPLFQRFLDTGQKTLVVTGMEAHICVFQTVRALCQRGFEVHVPADAVISRTPENRVIGLDLCRRAGAVVTSTEAVMFDLIERAGTDEFRVLSKLVK